jgi:hypothetical protein
MASRSADGRLPPSLARVEASGEKEEKEESASEAQLAVLPMPVSCGVLPLSRTEVDRNYLFRGGDEAHFFYVGGRKAVPEWRDRDEADVLIERVKRKVKPVASIVLVNYDKSQRLRILKKCRKLHRRIIRNEWGVDELLITATPDASLYDLLTARGIEGDNLRFRGGKHKDLGNRKLSHYVSRGFDCSGKRPVSRLECALLFGYPLRD